MDGVHLDFDSSDEDDINDYLEEKEHEGSYVDMSVSKSHSALGNILDQTGEGKSLADIFVNDTTFEQKESERIMFLEDAKDVLLQSVEYLTKGISNVEKMK